MYTKYTSKYTTTIVEIWSKAFRMANKVAVGGPYLARLVDLDGTGKKWRVDTPKWVQEVESEEEEDPEPTSKKRGRGAEEEPEEDVGDTPAEETQEKSMPINGRRQRKSKQ